MAFTEWRGPGNFRIRGKEGQAAKIINLKIHEPDEYFL